MKNCEMKLNGNILTITVDISKDFGVSSPEREDIKIGLNIYRKA